MKTNDPGSLSRTPIFFDGIARSIKSCSVAWALSHNSLPGLKSRLQRLNYSPKERLHHISKLGGLKNNTGIRKNFFLPLNLVLDKSSYLDKSNASKHGGLPEVEIRQNRVLQIQLSRRCNNH